MDFKDQMANRTDEELIRIVTILKNKYQAKAVECAEQELKRRDISEEDYVRKLELAKAEHELEQELNDLDVNPSLRLVNSIIDIGSISILALVFEYLLSFLKDPISLKFIIIAFYVIIFVAYYTLMEYIFKKTLGKFITRTKVVRMNGKDAKFEEVFVRAIWRLIPFDSISYIFTRNGFHDRFSNTRVIRDRAK